jgi:dynein heavy chain
MTTKMPNPHYLPEMFIRVNVINFTVTQEGLEQQLLAEIVKLENPAIEIKKLELTRAIVNDQKRMKKIEDDILSLLVNAGDNILDEEDLIIYLDKSKIVSAEINKAMEENEIAQIEI